MIGFQYSANEFVTFVKIWETQFTSNWEWSNCKVFMAALPLRPSLRGSPCLPLPHTHKHPTKFELSATVQCSLQLQQTLLLGAWKFSFFFCSTHRFISKIGLGLLFVCSCGEFKEMDCVEECLIERSKYSEMDMSLYYELSCRHHKSCYLKCAINPTASKIR